MIFHKIAQTMLFITAQNHSAFALDQSYRSIDPSKIDSIICQGVAGDETQQLVLKFNSSCIEATVTTTQENFHANTCRYLEKEANIHSSVQRLYSWNISSYGRNYDRARAGHSASVEATIVFQGNNVNLYALKLAKNWDFQNSEYTIDENSPLHNSKCQILYK